MAKWYGKIGFGVATEKAPGVWKDDIVERPYYGDVIKNTRRLVASDNQNDNVVISNEISIVSDPFANENFHSMKYIEFMGALHKVTNVDVQYPRLILSVGGVYNGKQATTA